MQLIQLQYVSFYFITPSPDGTSWKKTFDPSIFDDYSSNIYKRLSQHGYYEDWVKAARCYSDVFSRTDTSFHTKRNIEPKFTWIDSTF